MPKIKVPRKSTHMDMTAMCDIGCNTEINFTKLSSKHRASPIAGYQRHIKIMFFLVN